MTPLLWTLVAIQIAMGAFDTVYHHELTERLAWRTSQQNELRLHSIRNFFYALLFLVLGWIEPHGIWAMVIIAVLAAEIVITLMDFVEEDLSRKLPAIERVNHTVMAINYGAILALLLPALIDWAMRPADVRLADHGYLAIAATLAAIGAALFGLRDVFAASRLARLARLAIKPAVLVNGSAIGWYGLWQDQPLTESAKAHACFSHALCEAWEGAARAAEAHGVRVVYLRTGLVLGTEGGMITRMLTPFEFGLGGPIGSGRQWMSWIERDDLIRLIAHVIAHGQMAGPINATAPIPVTNERFTAELARRLHRPAVFRMPDALLRRIGGDFASELLLGGQRVLPNKALSNGFVFRHETLRSAFDAIL
jgi:uncharacterized protein (TIGR01777 family)